jgi:hypothetical protein
MHILPYEKTRADCTRTVTQHGAGGGQLIGQLVNSINEKEIKIEIEISHRGCTYGKPTFQRMTIGCTGFSGNQRRILSFSIVTRALSLHFSSLVVFPLIRIDDDNRQPNVSNCHIRQMKKARIERTKLTSL